MDTIHLQEEYEALTRELLEELGKLYLLQNDSGVLDPVDFEAYIQQQFAIIMNGATTSLSPGNILYERLRQLRTLNHTKDKGVLEQLETQWNLIQKFTEARTKYTQLVKETKLNYNQLKARQYIQDQNLQTSREDPKTTQLHELLLTLIIQGGYQGTSDKIDQWLQDLTT
ncbi:uncharacterized protein Ecym_7166 [Eremothecium cymbalariae DBVPG|uniref:Uncharacterized protein n=1 Tax=Eremothecium cymbalariae (strain CBS 270.75 / DBVPG 7215 / KCTC 17166 / NRRL Y-17582) TaxID=931890 RepID=G8JVZ9_ERECY|nr:hypothetical protein Ecym_7166 [Eremothecium cymbalariae DBVPG\